jgi:hypothetical protein
LVELVLAEKEIAEDRGPAQADTLRLNTALMSLNLKSVWGEGGRGGWGGRSEERVKGTGVGIGRRGDRNREGRGNPQAPTPLPFPQRYWSLVVSQDSNHAISAELVNPGGHGGGVRAASGEGGRGRGSVRGQEMGMGVKTA